ncbi:hypothetical protein K469DRAFT_683640 [Zopfia rhizophila CBS 207.26]|uniref:Uncharacterized protein n=1 Tax=Zopfia rhizophila CBS 207.26 TaxID=1314779 RepID=A0A6A6EB37_9PEZI|nr:hypothetical protein K469DRAFT_683640 [Zopfia rhizophila CBS 207.26]
MYLSVIAIITLFVVLDVLGIQHAAVCASRRCAWRLLHHLVAAAVLVYHLGTHVCSEKDRRAVARRTGHCEVCCPSTWATSRRARRGLGTDALIGGNDGGRDEYFFFLGEQWSSLGISRGGRGAVRSSKLGWGAQECRSAEGLRGELVLQNMEQENFWEELGWQGVQKGVAGPWDGFIEASQHAPNRRYFWQAVRLLPLSFATSSATVLYRLRAGRHGHASDHACYRLSNTSPRYIGQSHPRRSSPPLCVVASRRRALRGPPLDEPKVAEVTEVFRVKAGQLREKHPPRQSRREALPAA